MLPGRQATQKQLFCSQCVWAEDRCDGIPHCLSEADENCHVSYRTWLDSYPLLAPSPGPTLVSFDGKGFITLSAMNQTDSEGPLCREGHFQCAASLHHCLPVYVRCNRVRDCPGGEDEAECDEYLCPGLYRCRNVKVITITLIIMMIMMVTTVIVMKKVTAVPKIMMMFVIITQVRIMTITMMRRGTTMVMISSSSSSSSSAAAAAAAGAVAAAAAAAAAAAYLLYQRYRASYNVYN